VGAALEEPERASEERCERLARQQQFLHIKEPKAWPDGTITASYGFTHALYQQVLSQRVLPARRLRSHQRIGERLEAAYGAQADMIAAELAVHFEQGRDYARALRYLRLTAENAVRRYAYREALHYLIKGLHLLPHLPDVPERTQHELHLQATLGPTLMALKGTAAPEVEQAYQRARELSRQTGETTTLFPILRGLFASAVMQGRLAQGREYAEQLLQLAQSRNDSASLLQAHYALGMTYYRQGEFVAARSHLQHCQQLYDSQQHLSHALFYGGADPGVGAHCFMAWTLWYLGYADQALAQGRAATALAQSLAHPYSRAFALNFVAWVHKLRREALAAQTNADAAIAIALEHGYSQMVTLGTIVRGWALLAQGHEADGLEELQRGIEVWRAAGTEDGRPYFLALLADAYGKVARVADGLSLANEAIAVVEKNGAHVHEAHVYHLKGQLLLRQQDDRSPTELGVGEKRSLESRVQSQKDVVSSQYSVISREGENQKSKGKNRKTKITGHWPLTPSPQAEACFQHALRVARRQNAKALELRAAVSLGSLWARAGKQRQAKQLLSKIYGWFTEAQSTVDLREAQDLLRQWS
jgi:adenylate cyclase